jgi:hypothetical protein
MSRALSSGRMMLMVAVVDRHLRESRLEHRARFVPSGGEGNDPRIDIVEVEGGVAMSIQLRDKRFGVIRYHVNDDGQVAAWDDCGWFGTPGEAAARVAAVLRRAAA